MPIDKGVTSTIMRLAEREAGVSQPEVTRLLGAEHVRSVQRTLFELTRAGRLYKGGPHMHSRWFVHESHARAYDRRCNVPTKPTAQMRQLHSAAVGRQERAVLEGPIVITERTRVTIAPTPKSRYQVDEAPRVVDSQQCRPWAREALR